jgi:hypothetical protein
MSLNILNYTNNLDWSQNITVIEGFDKVAGAQKRVTTAYMTFFGAQTKVLILEEFKEIKSEECEKSSIKSIPNLQASSDQFEIIISTENYSLESPRLTNRSTIKRRSSNFLKPLLSENLKFTQDQTSKEINTQKVIIDSEAGFLSNKSETLHRTLEIAKESLIAKIHRRSRYLKLGLFCTTALICTFIIVILIETRLNSIECFNTIANIDFIATLRSYTAYLTLLTAELHLIDRGYSFNKSRETVQNMIGSLGKDFKSILEELYDISEYDILGEHLKHLDKINWEYQNGRFINRPTSILIMLKDIIIKCDNLAYTQHLNTTNTDLLEIYRNGPDNWFLSMQDLVYFLIKYNDWNAQNKFAKVEWLSVSIGIIASIMIITVVGIPYIMMLHTRRAIWEIIFRVRNHVLISGEVRAKERLSFIHNIESGFQNGSLNMRKNYIYKTHRYFIILILLIILLLLAVFGYLFYFNYIYIKNRLNLINKNPHYYNLAGLQRSNLFHSIFFARHIAFQDIDLQDHLLNNDPYELLDNSLDIISKANTDILGVAEISSEIYDEFFKQKDDGYFSLGIHSLDIELVQSFRDLSKYLRENRNYYEIGGLALENVTFEYCNRLFNKLVVDLDKGTQEIKDTQYLSTISMASIYMVGLIVYTVGVLFGIVSYIRNIILMEFYILCILPISDVKELVVKLRSI